MALQGATLEREETTDVATGISPAILRQIDTVLADGTTELGREGSSRDLNTARRTMRAANLCGDQGHTAGRGLRRIFGF